MATKVAPEYIPDSSRAENWLSEDVFVFKGQKYQILPDFQVVKIPKNGNGTEGKEHPRE